MSRLNSLIAQQRAKHTEHTQTLTAMDAATTADEKATLRTKAAGIKADFDAITGDIQVERDRLAAEERLAAELPDTAAQQAAEAAARRSGVQVGADRTAADPKKGFQTPREFVMAIMQHGMSGVMDARLKPLFQAGESPLLPVRKGAIGSDEQTGTSNPYGAFLIPEAFSPNVLMLEPEGDFTAGRTFQVPMQSKEVPFRARTDKNHSTSVSGGLTVTRKPETVEGTPTRIEFEIVKLAATSLYGFASPTEEMMQDSPASFAAMLARSFNQEFTNRRLAEIITGTGVGEPEGLLNAACLVSVTKETGQAAATIVARNIFKMRARAWGYSQCIWIANHDTLPQMLELSVEVGTGGAPIYFPSAREDRPDMLMGRPIFYTEYAKTLGTVGDLICVNLSQYLDGTYMPLQGAESLHARFFANERVFRYWLRNDARCWWRSALTPRNGANTLSPIVVLATRS